METIVMCIKGNGGECCIGRVCPLMEDCFPIYKQEFPVSRESFRVKEVVKC
jgi:hypothetical protein